MKATDRCSSIYMMCKGPVAPPTLRDLLYRAFIQHGRLSFGDIVTTINSAIYQNMALVRTNPYDQRKVNEIIDALIRTSVVVQVEPKRAPTQQPLPGGLVAGQIGSITGRTGIAAAKNVSFGGIFATYRIGQSRWGHVYEMDPLHRLAAAL